MKKSTGVILGIVAVIVITIIFGAALMGSIVGAQPKAIPVAIVIEDEGITLPDGQSINLGKQIAEQLQSNDAMPFEWNNLESSELLNEQLDNAEVYGGIVLPATLTQYVFSMMSEQPQVAEIEAFYNEGANLQASNLLKQAMPQIMPLINHAIREQLVQQLGAQTIPTNMIEALVTPIQLNEQVMHSIPSRNAMGNAPGLLAQLLWVSNLALAALLFFGFRFKKLFVSYGIKNRLQQLCIGVVLPPLLSGLVVWMADGWYGMVLANTFELWIWLTLIAYGFFFMQSSLLNLIGLPAAGLMVLLMFFSLPIVNMAPEFLSDATNTWIYSWSPLRIAATSIRSLLYFDGFNIKADANMLVMITIAVIGLVLLLLTSWLDQAKVAKKSKQANM